MSGTPNNPSTGAEQLKDIGIAILLLLIAAALVRPDVIADQFD